jgi:ubiquinone/menaquinone biosynthesis C-methylase UbiE
MAVFQSDGPTLMELARQALSSTERGYDLLAPKFDATPFRTPDPLLVPMAKAIGNAGRLLDVCCGTGAAIRVFRPSASEVVGVDFSAGMLAEARRRTADAPGTAPIRLVRTDARWLPFRDRFDTAVCVGALGHFVGADQDLFLDAIAMALVKGGRFAIISGGPISRANAGYWLAKGFNAAMHVRNALLKPEFVMFYLTFLLPEVLPLLEKHGFSARVLPADFPPPFGRMKLVVGTRR